MLVIHRYNSKAHPNRRVGFLREANEFGEGNRMPRTARKMKYGNIAELLSALGDISPERICMNPPPGTATKRDLLRMDGRGGKRYELVDRTLVEKPMGAPESFLATVLIRIFGRYLDDHDIGFLYAPDVLIQILPSLVRGPDVSFVPWTLRPEKTVPTEPISTLIPELVVEVLSPSNTKREIRRKLHEYFRAGVLAVWIIDPKTYTADVYTDLETKTTIPETSSLDGEEILPGFKLPLQKLFARLERPKKPKPPKG